MLIRFRSHSSSGNATNQLVRAGCSLLLLWLASIPPECKAARLADRGSERAVSRVTDEPVASDSIADLNIIVVEGGAAIHNVTQRTAREMIVEVDDRNHRPVAGVVVTFIAPSQGPGGSFSGGKNFLSLLTGSDGRVRTKAFEPNAIQGKFTLYVTASCPGHVGSKAITQTNGAGSPTSTNSEEPPTSSAEVGAAGNLNIAILESDDGPLNSTKRRTSREMIVQVNDNNHRPVAGAIVTFMATGEHGNSALDGTKFFALVTQENGRVTAQPFELSRKGADFNLQITATSQGQVGTKTFITSQANGTVNVSSAQSEAAQAAREADGMPNLNVVVIEGDGVINNVKQRTPREMIVQVEDKNHNPIGGALVTFVAPRQGPAGSFVGQNNTLSLMTGNDGRVTVTTFQPNGVEGPFRLDVTASSQGHAGTATITQTNRTSEILDGSNDASDEKRQHSRSLLLNVVASGGTKRKSDQSKSPEMIIEVIDQNRDAVEGAVVTLMPVHPNSNRLVSSEDVLTLATGQDGRVKAKPVNASGVQLTPNIHLTASYNELVATREITQIYAIASQSPQPSPGEKKPIIKQHKKAILITCAVAAGVAIAVILASHGGGYHPPGF